MDLNELYASIPEDQWGNIAVSAGAVSITQADQSVVKLIREKAEDTAQLTDTAGIEVESVRLELLKSAAKLSSSALRGTE